MVFFNVAPKKETFFFNHFPKEYVGRSVHTECREQEVIYKQQDVKGSISL